MIVSLQVTWPKLSLENDNVDPNARPRERNVYMTPVVTWPKLRKMSWRDGLVKLVGVERPWVELESVGNLTTTKLRKSQVQRLTGQGDMINGWPVCVRRRGKTESDGSEKVYLLSICWTSLVTCQLLFHIHWFSSLLHLLLVPFFLDQNVFSTPTLSFKNSRWIGPVGWFLSLGSKAKAGRILSANPVPSSTTQSLRKWHCIVRSLVAFFCSLWPLRKQCQMPKMPSKPLRSMWRKGICSCSFSESQMVAKCVPSRWNFPRDLELHHKYQQMCFFCLVFFFWC